MPQFLRSRRRLGGGTNRRTRYRAERPDHVWSDDFVMGQTAGGRRVKVLPIVDGYTRACSAIEVERGMTAEDEVSSVEYLLAVRGVPGHIGSDNGPGFIAEAVKGWLPLS